jgi:hypothetical protein
MQFVLTRGEHPNYRRAANEIAPEICLDPPSEPRRPTRHHLQLRVLLRLSWAGGASEGYVNLRLNRLRLSLRLARRLSR